jgi:Spx/MgsR family transcriptional regulator
MIWMIQLYLKPNCSTCRKARTLLRAGGAVFQEIDLNQGLSEAELDKLIGERDYRRFLNTRNALYRERGMNVNTPSRAEALRLMAANPNLIKRPILALDGRIALGCDAEAIRALSE